MLCAHGIERRFALAEEKIRRMEAGASRPAAGSTAFSDLGDTRPRHQYDYGVERERGNVPTCPPRPEPYRFEPPPGAS